MSNGGGDAIEDYDATFKALWGTLCECPSQRDARQCYPSFDFVVECAQRAYREHESEVSPVLRCAVEQASRERDCLQKSCDTLEQVQACAAAEDEKACGTLPESVRLALRQCDETFTCNDGKPIKGSEWCNGQSDCEHGEDEVGCANPYADAGAR